jgi:enoyl-CoA hydratase/carnithine racemase
MGRARALEILPSADDYDAELAERYGWIDRALPARSLDGFVRSLAHRIARFPAPGLVEVKEHVDEAFSDSLRLFPDCVTYWVPTKKP